MPSAGRWASPLAPSPHLGIDRRMSLRPIRITWHQAGAFADRRRKMTDGPTLEEVVNDRTYAVDHARIRDGTGPDCFCRLCRSAQAQDAIIADHNCIELDHGPRLLDRTGKEQLPSLIRPYLPRKPDHQRHERHKRRLRLAVLVEPRRDRRRTLTLGLHPPPAISETPTALPGKPALAQCSGTRKPPPVTATASCGRGADKPTHPKRTCRYTST